MNKLCKLLVFYSKIIFLNFLLISSLSSQAVTSKESEENNDRVFEMVDKYFPLDSSDRFVSRVPAGTVVIEDTRGVHRGAVPELGYRDLGYAVFFPQRPADQVCRFRVCPEVLNELTPFQRAFLMGID